VVILLISNFYFYTKAVRENNFLKLTSKKVYDSLLFEYNKLDHVHFVEKEKQKEYQKQDSIRIALLKEQKKKDSILIAKLKSVDYSRKTGNQLVNLLDSAYNANNR
jgi:hypothetical protein